MLLETDGLISLSVDEKVNWSRPSIDVFFESAAVARGEDIVGIILSGANADGARGMMAIRQAGGLTIAQSPDEAESPTMPLAAINTGAVCEVLRADEIVKRLLGIGAA
jgi:two-component system chemotaxis response regulator CheB